MHSIPFCNHQLSCRPQTHLIFLFFFCLSAIAVAEKKLKVVVLEENTHDASMFTQGFIIDDEAFIESSGGYGNSLVRRYHRENGKILASRKLPADIFAEGLTRFGSELFLLTWRAQRALVLDPKNLSFKRQLRYQGEGWGITHDGQQLITSDGSETLSFRSPKDFSVLRTVSVHNAWRKYRKINELEFAQSSIWANVWEAPIILKVSPTDGRVLGIARLKALVDKNSTIPKHTVLNGIAYDPQKKAFWITGKLWPKRYLVRFE